MSGAPGGGAENEEAAAPVVVDVEGLRDVDELEEGELVVDVVVVDVVVEEGTSVVGGAEVTGEDVVVGSP